MRRVAIGAMALIVLLTQTASANTTEPYLTSVAKNSGICKSENNQQVTGKWQTFAGCDPFVLDGNRSLFFAQLHINCTKRPKYVKIRLARIKQGKDDTTGTTTFSFTKSTTRDWQGTMWWEAKTEYPIVAQFKVVGGKCYSDQRQLKWWQP